MRFRKAGGCVTISSIEKVNRVKCCAILFMAASTFANAGCTTLFSIGESAEKQARPSPEALRSIIEKNASFDLKKFPVGFWNYLHMSSHAEHINEAEVQDWADAGFTLTKSPSYNPKDPEQLQLMKDLLKWANERGMKLIVRDWRVYGDELPQLISDFRDNPAVFGFHVCDEPHGESCESIFELCRRLKKAAPERHAFINLGPYGPGVAEWLGFDTYADYINCAAGKGNLDFLCFDNYVQMNPGTSGWDDYFANLRLIREGAWRYGIPFWTTLVSVGHYHYRCPNYDDLRWQFNSAICSGATGVLWFFYYMRDPHSNYRFPPVDEYWEKTHTYYDLQRIQTAFHKRYGDLFLKLAPTRVTFYPEAFGDGEVFTPNELLLDVWTYKKDRRILVGEFVDIEGRRYMMVVNNSTTNNAHVVLTFPKHAKSYSWNWQGKEYEGTAYSHFGTEHRQAGYVAGYWLAPGQELVQRVEAEGIRKTEIATPTDSKNENDQQKKETP